MASLLTVLNASRGRWGVLGITQLAPGREAQAGEFLLKSTSAREEASLALQRSRVWRSQCRAGFSGGRKAHQDVG